MSSKETKKRKTKGQEGITKKKKKVQAQDGEEDVDAEDTAPLSIKKKKSKNVEATGDKEDAKEAETFSQPKKTKRGGKRKRRQRATLEHIRATPRVETFVHDEKSRKKFADFDLDERILKGIGELGWVQPTDVQLSMIGLALEGRNIMARARTGSGKTAAFVLPTLQRVLQVASTTSGSSAVSPGPLAIYIAPSKELATQVVATPGKLSTLLKLRPDFLAEVKHVVLDEADLLLSLGYESEMKFIRGGLPSHYQCILTSATLTDDMSQLKTLFMTGPVVTIKLKEGDLPDASQLTQYQLSCLTDEERFAILLAIIKLRLIVGKTIIFVNTTDRCYKLNIFLAAFSIRSCILNAAMPANSRCHVINEFNKGLYPIVVASDASVVAGQGPLKEDEDGVEVEPKKGVGRRKLDKESGVARGIDFHRVSNVINFDFPTSLDKYIHRVGRTARGFNKGTALSFCTPEETKYLEKVKTEMTKQLGEDVLSPYEMRIRELDSFVLRAREALNACTKMVIREARLAEIRMEALRSAKLQAYFAKNPREKDLLERDKKLHSLNLHCPAIGDVPDYIVPKALRGLDYGEDKKTGRRNGQKHRRKVIRTIRILYYLMAEKVKRYEKIKHLGEGQFANVYKAKDLEKGDIVAIKKIKLGSRSEIMDGVNRTALREIKLLQELDHENIIGLRDVIGGKMNIQLVMDFMETDLEHVVKDASIILLSSHIKNIVLQTLLGLEFLHENWILHRDLKPNNLLMNARGRIKIADFGLARYFGSPNRVLTHQVVTRWYRAPELIFAANSYGVGVDMWAIGCIVAELLLRNPLFPGESDLDQLQKIVQVMGSPTQQSWPEMTSLHDFVRISIPPHPCPDEELPLPARVTGKPQLSKRRRMNGTSPPGLRRKLVFD